MHRTTRTAPSAPAAQPAKPVLLGLEIVAGDDVLRLLTDAAFGEAWDGLLAFCPWSTAFQRRDFTSLWYRTYADLHVPLLVVGYGDDGSVAGVLALARERGTGRILSAGAHHAEYQTWLAHPRLGDEFAARAMTALRGKHPAARVVFRYLAPGTPTAWTQGDAWRSRCVHEPESRALLDTGDEKRGAAALRKKSNRSRLNRLKRHGDVTFERVTTDGGFSAVLDEIIPMYDLRQGAAHRVLPFAKDASKRPFHEALFDLPDFLHVTVTRAGGRVVAAHVGVLTGDSVSLGVYTHAPDLARHSPGKLHLLMLAGKLAEEGVETLDLTPGGEWKERFATRTDTVSTLRVNFAVLDRVRHAARLGVDRFAKSVALALGTTPGALRSRVQRPRADALRALLRGRDVTELLSLPAATGRRIEGRETHAPCTLSQLVADRPRRAGETFVGALADAEARLAAGWVPYGRRGSGPAALAWSRHAGTGDEPCTEGDAVLSVSVAPREQVDALLRRLVHDASHGEGTQTIWLNVRGDPAVFAAARALGFEHRYSRTASRLERVPRPRPGPSSGQKMRELAKRAVLHTARAIGLFHLARRLTRRDLRILCYHGFSVEDEVGLGPRLFMEPATFGRHMDLLKRWGFPVLVLGDALDALASDSHPDSGTVITIDDGPWSVLSLGLPHLERNGFPATLYQTTYYTVKQAPVFNMALRYVLWRAPRRVLRLDGLIPDLAGDLDIDDATARGPALAQINAYAAEHFDEPARQVLAREVAVRLAVDYDLFEESRVVGLLTVDELRELGERGIDVQLHTHRHRFPADFDVVRREIADNRDVLEPVATRPLEHLCYPSSEHYSEQFEWMRDLGIVSGTTCDTGFVRRGDDPYRLGRILDGECVPDIELQAEMFGFLELVRRVRG